MLPGRVGATGEGALLRVAALPLEVELHTFATTELADRTNVTSHNLTSSQPQKRATDEESSSVAEQAPKGEPVGETDASDAPTLGRPATIVRNRRYVANQSHLEPGRLKRSQRALAASSRALNEHSD